VKRRPGLVRDESGAGAIEFAIVAPVLFAMLIGMAQLGILFFANAGLKNAVGEGARYATLFPRPTDTQIIARINAKKYGLTASRITGPTIVSGTSNGATYADITMTYSAPIDFIFYRIGPVTLTQTRRVWTQPSA
jgi:Flp pilus assembly protein TadG